MVETPQIEWFGCHPLNTIPRPSNIYYEAIVIHTTGGGSTIEGLAAWFNGGNIAAGLRGSTYFGVDRAGRIGQFLTPYTSVAPIANGAYANATAKLCKDNEGLNANFWTLNIEHLDANVPGSVTAIQLERSAWLCAYLWEQWIAPYAHITGATLDRDHLLQHKEFDPSGKPFCASWDEPRMTAHIQKIQTLLAPPSPQPEPPPATDWEAAYKSLEQKHAQLDREAEAWCNDDAVGAQMRLNRLAELRAWNP